jgi:hypothetical protein
MLAFALFAAAASGCYGDSGSGSGSGDAGGAPAYRYPTGLATDAPTLHTTSGVYPASANDDTCCWLNGNAHFFMPAQPGATSLTIQVYVPPVGPLATNPGTVSILDAHGKPVATKGLKNGIQTLTLALAPKSTAGGLVSIRLKTSTAFVPKDLGLNGDIRRLSVVLMSAQLSNASS